jgi:glutaredoxin
MKKRYYLILTITGLAVAIVLVILFANSTGQYDEFAQCLTDKGVIMYGTEWCSFCSRQKNLFGNSFNYINFVDCDKNKEKCLLEGITGYPTLKINGEYYPGLKSIEDLGRISGCKL